MFKDWLSLWTHRIFKLSETLKLFAYIYFLYILSKLFENKTTIQIGRIQNNMSNKYLSL